MKKTLSTMAIFFLLFSCQKLKTNNNEAYSKLIGTWTSKENGVEKYKFTFKKNGVVNYQQSCERNRTYKVNDINYKASDSFFKNGHQYILDGTKNLKHIDGPSFYVNQNSDSMFLYGIKITNGNVGTSYGFYLTRDL